MLDLSWPPHAMSQGDKAQKVGDAKTWGLEQDFDYPPGVCGVTLGLIVLALDTQPRADRSEENCFFLWVGYVVDRGPRRSLKQSQLACPTSQRP